MKKKFKKNLQSFLKFLLGPKLLSWIDWALARPKGGLVLFGSLFIMVGFLYISSPKSLVIDKYDHVEGIINQLRLFAQGRRFLNNQLDRAETIIHSNGYSDRSISLIMEEVEEQMEVLERSIGISDGSSYSDILRREADRFESKETEELIEKLRQRRVEDCNIIVPYIHTRLREIGPSYTHWLLLICFVLTLTFSAVLLYPNAFRSILVNPDMLTSGEIKYYLDTCLEEDLSSRTVIYHLHSIQARLVKRLSNEGFEDETVGISIPYFNNVYLARGLVKQLTKDYIGALEDYNMVFKAGPFYPTALYYYFKGTANYHLSNYEESLSELDYLIHFYRPPQAAAYYFRGLTKLRMKDEEEARKDFKIASEIGYSRAEKLLKLPDLKEASLKRAI